MWLSIDQDGSSGASQPVSMGFTINPNWPNESPSGTITPDDDRTYDNTYYSGTINISDAQYQQLILLQNNPEAYGFSHDYGLSNNCVDFVWKALEVVGLNPFGYEGTLAPIDNTVNIDKVLYNYSFHTLEGWNSDFAKHVPIFAQYLGYDVIYGDETDNNLQANFTDVIYGVAGDDTLLGDHRENYLFGGEGNDVLTGNNGNDYLEGNENNDELNGGQGNDQLFGGYGDDTYIYNSGDGFDAKNRLSTIFCVK
jgi:Ca2+-binding RTX toxin-like protein